MSAPQNIAAERAAWLGRLCADKAVKLVPLRVAVIIGNHINGKLGEAWPSQTTIADLLGMTRGNVNRTISELVAMGYLTVRKEGYANRYAMALPAIPADNSSRTADDTAAGDIDHGEQRIPWDSEVLSGKIANRYPRGGPICEEPRTNSEGTAPKGACAVITEPPVKPQSPNIVKDKAGAPEGARLPPRLVADIEEAFCRALHPHEARQFLQLIEKLGRPEVQSRIAAYGQAVEGGRVQRIPMARWLRQAGLVEISHVA